jgi:serine phosphatase RsbU (regulator of sigma subunit)
LEIRFTLVPIRIKIHWKQLCGKDLSILLEIQKILKEAIKAIEAAHPELAPFLGEGKLQAQLACLLEHAKTLLEGNEISSEEGKRCSKMSRKLAAWAADHHIEIETLIHCTYIFRHTLWQFFENQDVVGSALPTKHLLHAIIRINEHLSETNLMLMHEYLERERQIVKKQQERMNADLALARRIQQSMFPASCSIGACKLCAEIIPSTAVGGDFYGMIPLGNPPSRADLYIGDVQGKGVAAALVMMLMTSILRAAATPQKTPKQIVSEANRHFVKQMSPELSLFVSLFYLSYDVHTRKITYTKAGHEDGLLVRARTGELVTLSTPGYFLGIFEEAPYEEKTLLVEPGDRLYLFTDGITVMGRRDGKMTEYADLYKILLQYNKLPIDETLHAVTRELMQQSPEEELKDDVGFLVAEF